MTHPTADATDDDSLSSEEQCIKELQCVVNPQSDTCLSLNEDGDTCTVTLDGTTSFDSASTLKGGNSFTFSPSTCSPSTAYPNCFFTVLGASRVETYAENCFANYNQFAALLYYSDDSCSSFAATRTLSNRDSVVTRGDGSSCEESVQCLLNPSSEGCQAIADGTETVSVEVLHCAVCRFTLFVALWLPYVLSYHV